MRRLVLVAGAAALVAVQFAGSLALSASALVGWLLLLRLCSPGVLRRVLKPRLWALALLISMGSGLLLGEGDRVLWGVSVSLSGLAAGVWMVVRGVSLLSVASLGATALTRDGATDALARIGLGGAAHAIRVAAATLPAAQERVVAAWCHHRPQRRRPRELARAVDGWFAAVVEEAAALAEGAEREPPTEPGGGS